MSIKASERSSPLWAMGLLALYALVSLALVSLALEWALEGSAALARAGYQAPQQRKEALSRWRGARALTPPSPPRLHALFLGLSTLRDGVDLPALRAALPDKPPSLSLAGSGGSFERLAYLALPVLEDPELSAYALLVMAHPLWLAGWDPMLVDDEGWGAALSAALGGRLGPLKQRLKADVWLIKRRLVLTQGLEAAFVEAREVILTALGVHLDLLYPPLADPWARPPSRRDADQAPASKRAAQWAHWTSMGKWEASLYQMRRAGQLRALGRLVAAAEGKVERVILVRMPEGQALRAAVPEEARTALTSTALSAALGRPVEVWDLSSSLDEACFFDHAHLNAHGRARLTEALAARLR
ncbi:hypothetical protein KKF91_05445 [Myxococcota bacterium]|nr:hypothetical protein [Myxococcota bacterium]